MKKIALQKQTIFLLNGGVVWQASALVTPLQLKSPMPQVYLRFLAILKLFYILRHLPVARNKTCLEIGDQSQNRLPGVHFISFFPSLPSTKRQHSNSNDGGSLKNGLKLNEDFRSTKFTSFGVLSWTKLINISRRQPYKNS